MMRTALWLCLLILLTGCSKHNEAYYQRELCESLGGEMEYRLPDRSRVDCLTERYAIEVEFAKKWAEGIGQSLYYAHESGRKPAIGIIVRDTQADRQRLRRLRTLSEPLHIRIFEIQGE